MTRFLRLLVPLLALTLLCAGGIFPASAATSAQFRNLTLTPGSRVVPPTNGLLGGGPGGGVTDGDPDDIIEGNRVIAVANGSCAQLSAPTHPAALLWFRVGGLILLLRRLRP